MSMNWQELLDTAAEGGTYEALPEGPYQVQVDSAEAKNASTGKPMIVAKFKVMAGPYAGRLVWNNFVVTSDNANAMSWFFRNMAALGLDKSFFAMNPSLEAVAAALVGKQCEIGVTQKTYNNEIRNDVKSIKALAAGAASAAAPQQAAPASPSPAPTPEPQPQAQPAEQSPAPAQPAAAPEVPF